MDKYETNLSTTEILDSERELKLALYLIIYRRLEKYFATRNIKITRDTDLKTILRPEAIQTDWEGLNSIGLTMPMLRLPKFLNYIITFYVVCVSLLVLTLVTKYFEFIVILQECQFHISYSLSKETEFLVTRLTNSLNILSLYTGQI